MIPRMTAFPRLRSAPRWARGAARRAGLAALLALAACSTDTLSVEDPDIIDPDDVQSAAGAEAVRLGALGRLNNATSGGSSTADNIFLLGGLFSDLEWGYVLAFAFFVLLHLLVSGTRLSSVTDALGAFTLRGVPAGTHQLRVGGYTEREQRQRCREAATKAGPSDWLHRPLRRGNGRPTSGRCA